MSECVDSFLSPMPIVSILGPSGVGKSTLSKWLAEEDEFLHVEIDRHPQDGIKEEGLRVEWDQFYAEANFEPLRRVLLDRGEHASRAGVILSLSSLICFEPIVLEDLSAHGITPVILYAEKEACMRSFLERETISGRGLGADHWDANNKNFDQFGAEGLSRFRVLGFQGGERVSRARLLSDVRSRIKRQVSADFDSLAKAYQMPATATEAPGSVHSSMQR